MKYVKQRDMYSCSVIVIINAMKWKGWKASVNRNYSYIKEKIGCEKAIGGLRSLKKFDKYVSKINAKRVWHPTIGKVNSSLDKGEALMIAYKVKGGGHFVFVDKKIDEDTYSIINNYHPTESKFITYDTISKTQLHNRLRRRRGSKANSSCMWSVKQGSDDKTKEMVKLKPGWGGLFGMGLFF